MEQVGRVHIFQTFDGLVNDVLFVDVLKNVSSDNGMQICVHEVEYEVNIPIVLGPDYILESNDVFVAV